MPFFIKRYYDKIYSKMTDQELIGLYKQKGDNRIIGEIFNRYAHLVFGVVCKYLKNDDEQHDAVMDVFEKLFDSFKEHNILNFKCWLYSVTKNYCLMWLRKEKSVSFNDELLLKNFQQDFMDFEQNFSLNHHDDELIGEKLPEAIKKLNHEQKTCIDLFYLQNKSYKEITDITNYSLNQVKSYIQNGKRNLKLILENKK